VNRLGIEERVVFAGEVDPREVPVYDAAADLMFAMYEAVDPNNVVTIPNKLFESIAAAKPILVPWDRCGSSRRGRDCTSNRESRSGRGAVC